MLNYFNLQIQSCKSYNRKVTQNMENTFREQIRSEFTKIKKMTFAEKKEYIWDYYKIHIIGVLVIIGAIVGSIMAFNANNYKTVFNAVIADGYMTGQDDRTDALTTGFSEYLGIDGVNERAIFNYNISLKSKAGDEDVYYSRQKLITMSAAREIDGFIAEYDSIGIYSDDETLFLTDLNELFTSEELAKMDSYIVYFTKSDGSKIPIGIDLTSTFIKTEQKLYMTRPCYGVAGSSLHKDTAVKFIKYALGM